MRVVHQASLLACLGIAVACRHAPLGLAPTTGQVQITNPHHLALRLSVVDGSSARPLTELGSGAEYALTLVAGAYVLHARTDDGEFALPVPLFAATLSDAPPLQVRVSPPPPSAAHDAQFAFIPAGPAVVGDTLGIGQEDERPARIVEVPAFWLGRREVSNAEFVAFLAAQGPQVVDAWCAFDSRKFRCRRDAAGHWSTEAPDLPVVTVSHAGAEAFCAWRTQVTGVRHRLPSEAEWEKAARGPASFVYAYGNVYLQAFANQESGTLRAVAQSPANGFGLFDMTGNAFEWTADVYRDRSVPERPVQGGTHVLRGGSFVLDGMYLRNSFRMRQWPDVRTDDIGFRVARDLP